METPDYGSTNNESAKQSFVEITVDEEAANQPTLAPVGSRLKRNAQIEYNPFDWRRTILVVKGRPYLSKSYYVVFAIGTALVIISRLVQIGEDDRSCRAWCSSFALGTQPHAYMGFILFLLMSFRTSQSYRNYVSGQHAFYEIKTRIRMFTHVLLNMIPRDAVSKNNRARMLAYAIAFPFTLTAEIRKERQFEKNTVEKILSNADMDVITSSASMPLYVLEALSQMTEAYCEDAGAFAKKTLHDSILALYRPYSEAERIAFNPMGFAYVAHLRLLLLTYLTTLPLALVEQMGFSTIPVFWVITYALMSLEMLAVEVENPFGHQGSDLRLFQYNVLVRDTVLESWTNWVQDRGAELSGKDVADYDDFGETQDDEEISSWFDYW